ncbi:type II toxin-antitoxin system PemK/MazF family toxin [Piscirickettsia salmonis]|uniref:type II toxin-antitoxin system PemK/MazF family toxin n=1 Tax=Piscirickettsia salmonis TaxID=1238 RepID=UPI0007C983D6|nr:PemK-like protein [Piscirickettsiaceae bacterium NZ-RLO1]
MIYDPYSVVLTPFPFTDKSASKKRPALVISCARSQEHNSMVTCLMITSLKGVNQVRWWGDQPINDLESAGLPVPSIVRQKVFTIDSRLIIKQLGLLNENDMLAIRVQLGEHLVV